MDNYLTELLKQAEQSLKQLRKQAIEKNSAAADTQVYKNALGTEIELSLAREKLLQMGIGFGAFAQTNQIPESVPVVIVVNGGDRK